jgi:hypothetical protein
VAQNCPYFQFGKCANPNGDHSHDCSWPRPDFDECSVYVLIADPARGVASILSGPLGGASLSHTARGQTPANGSDALAAVPALLTAQERIVPASLIPVVSELDGISESTVDSRFTRDIPISLILAALAGTAFGGAVSNRDYAFFAGLAVAIVTYFLLMRGWEAASWPLLRRQAVAAAAKSDIPPDRASEIATALHRERLLSKTLKGQLAMLPSKTLSDDLLAQLAEAMVLAKATVGLSELLTPTRALGTARDSLRPVQELVNSASARMSQPFGISRNVFATIAAILDNRERLFAALDSCERSTADSSTRVADTVQENSRADLLLEANQLLRYRAASKAKADAQIAFTEALLSRQGAPKLRLVLFRSADPQAEYPWLVLKAGTFEAIHSYAGSSDESDRTFASLFGNQPRSIIWADHIVENCPRPGEVVTQRGRQVYEQLTQDIRDGRYVVERIVRE